MANDNLKKVADMLSGLKQAKKAEQSQLEQERKDLILGVGKQISDSIAPALSEMAKRIKSKKIQKTISLLISSIQSGGNLAVLLEETAVNMRERNFVEKKSASNVLMYVIFIFAATAIGAPILFALSSVLVNVVSEVLSTIPSIDSSANLPFTLTQLNISTTFITYFALMFLIVTDLISALVIGLVTKGEEKEGFKYIIPLAIIGIAVFFAVRFTLLNYFSGIF